MARQPPREQKKGKESWTNESKGTNSLTWGISFLCIREEILTLDPIKSLPVVTCLLCYHYYSFLEIPWIGETVYPPSTTYF